MTKNQYFKELKKQLMGFDEINNITPQTNSGGSGGTPTGIDDKLLKFCPIKSKIIFLSIN